MVATATALAAVGGGIGYTQSQMLPFGPLVSALLLAGVGWYIGQMTY